MIALGEDVDGVAGRHVEAVEGHRPGVRLEHDRGGIRAAAFVDVGVAGLRQNEQGGENGGETVRVHSVKVSHVYSTQLTVANYLAIPREWNSTGKD